MPQFIDTEKKICELFTQGTVFDYNGVRYTVSSSAAKPTTKKGNVRRMYIFLPLLMVVRKCLRFL